MTSRLVDDCFRPNQERLRHAEAITLLRARLEPVVDSEIVALIDATGRILRDSVVATDPVPAHSNSAVDGYAFAHATHAADPSLDLVVSGRSAAGHPFAGHLAPHSAVRIFTGAVLPDGADTVAMQEDTDLAPGINGRLPTVRIPAGLKRGANVRVAGEDLKRGAAVLDAGRQLRPQDIAALASIGRGSIRVARRLRVAIVSTGDEIISPGSGALAAGQVYDANAAMLAGLARSTGAEVNLLGIWPDSLEQVTANLTGAAADHDVIITSGGASLGEEDHMAKALSRLGSRHFWQIAVKPGRPMMFGQIARTKVGGGAAASDTIVIGLPGNPVAVLVCFLMYTYPMLRRLGGGDWPEPRRFALPAGFAFANRKLGRREFWRGMLRDTGAGFVVDKFARDGSGLISGLRVADGLIDIAEDAGDVAVGDLVDFIPFSEFGIVK
jgi:molybdopterin molybdotransferase